MTPPAAPRMRVTTSWDDGHQLDLRVAAMLEHYGLKGTFYVAPADRHHGPAERLRDQDIRQLAQRHEIGAHTFSHVNLAEVSVAEGREEIRRSKAYLEHILGQEVTSFCYPYGAYRPESKRAVQELGFTYARTVERFRYRAHDRFAAPTTVHTYNHWSDAGKVLQFARYNPQLAARYRDWSELAIALFDQCREFGGDFHLWGHSWELEEHGHWAHLERVLRHVAGHAPDIQAVTNGELFLQEPQETRPKLLLSASYFPPKVGGLERYAHEVARGLQTSGHDVVVLTSGDTPQTQVEHRPDGLTVYHLGTQLRLSNTPVGLYWYGEIKKVIEFERPDLVNPHLPVPYLGDLTALAAQSIPVVVTYHSGSMKKRNFVLDRITEVYENLVLPLTLRRARHIICSSDSVRNGFLKRYRFKSTTVTPGVDRELFRTRSHVPGGRQVLFIGNFSYSWKGLDYLRAAVASLPDVELNVIGEGDQVPQERVHYQGVLHGEELVQAIQQADVLVLPSTAESESFGMVLVEAMSCGVPVIGSRIGGIPYVISDGEDGLLTRPRDPQDLARAIRQTLDQPQETARRVERALDKVRTQFDWKDTIVPRYLSVLQQVMAGPAHKHLASADPASRTVTHVSAYYPPHLGGMELVAQSLSHELAHQGLQVNVLTSDVGVDPRLAERQANPRVQYLPALEVAHTPLAPGLLPALWKLPRGSLLHLHAAQAYWPEVMMLVAAVRGQPYIVHFHLDVEPSGRLGFLLGTYKKTLFRLVMQRAARVIVLQEDQRSLVARKYGVQPQNIAVIPNAVRPEFFVERGFVERDFVESGAARPAGPLRLLYVGRLTVQKRVDRLLDMAALLGPRIQLDIVGDGEDREKLAQQAQRLGLQNVRFSGVKRGSDLLDAYRQADVFITASSREGMPLTLLEAMAAGLPVVGSDVVGLHDLLQGTGVLVSPPEPPEFARAIEHLLAHPEQLLHLSKASRKKAEAHAWPTISSDITGLYEQLWT